MKFAPLTNRVRTIITAWRNRFLSFSSQVHRILPPHFSAIQLATTELDAVMAEIEARFIQVSNTLEVTTTTGQELVEHGEGLIALALGQGGGEILIESTAEHIWRAIDFVEGSISESHGLIDQLTSANAQISRTLETEAELARTLAPLTYVQTLFRVESAGLDADVQAMFHSLVHEIERVRQHVEREFQEKFQLLRDIQAILTRSIRHLQTREGQAKQAVSILRRHLTESLAQMKQAYEKNRDRDTRLSSVSKAVAQETGRVVMCLQFYDSLTQKLQHARKIIGEMEARYADLPADRPAAGRTLRFVQQSGLICGGQLAAMESELIHSGQALSSGLGEIMRQLTALNTDCIALRDLDSVTTGVDGAVQILLNALVEVRQLVGDAENFATESHQSIEPIGNKTTNFTKFISNLAFEIQLIGLNAEIQSAHVGRGTGLEILSAQTSAISRETSQLSTHLAVELDALTEGLAKIVHSFRDLRERSSTFSLTLTKEAAQAGVSLHDYRDSALQILQHVGDLLPKLEEHTRSATAQSDFVSLATTALARLQGTVTGLGAAAQAVADGAGIEAEPPGLTEHFFKLYTMSSEGAVHRQALGLPGTAAPPTAPVPTGVEVDLFGFDEPPAANSIPASSDVELFGVAEPPAAPAAEPENMRAVDKGQHAA